MASHNKAISQPVSSVSVYENGNNPVAMVYIFQSKFRMENNAQLFPFISIFATAGILTGTQNQTS